MIQLAYDNKSNTYILIKNVPSKLKDRKKLELTCPHCEAKVTPVKGAKRVHHFRHVFGEEDEPENFESPETCYEAMKRLWFKHLLVENFAKYGPIRSDLKIADLVFDLTNKSWYIKIKEEDKKHKYEKSDDVNETNTIVFDLSDKNWRGMGNIPRGVSRSYRHIRVAEPEEVVYCGNPLEVIVKMVVDEMSKPVDIIGDMFKTIREELCIYLQVPFAEKDHAKCYGCSWNPDIKKWFTYDGELMRRNREYCVRNWGLDAFKWKNGEAVAYLLPQP